MAIEYGYDHKQLGAVVRQGLPVKDVRLRHTAARSYPRKSVHHGGGFSFWAAMHILIVEDSALVASGIKTGLELHDFTCDIAASLAEAGRYMTGSHFDACILDLGPPDGDGLRLLGQWRGAALHLPVLILSARDRIEDKVAGFQTGRDDYLTKPFDLTELVLRLHALLHDSLYGFDQDVGSNTVNVHMHHLRRKLGQEVIETVRGLGFRLGIQALTRPAIG